jgi:Domain of unknown function (DUF4388)
VEGNLRETSLESVLELIHVTQQSGLVTVESDVPLSLHLAQGEIQSGGILDWTDVDAVRSFKLHEQAGTFRFQKDAVNPNKSSFKMPFSMFVTEWARINDEWDRVRAAIDSPSRVLEYAGPATPEPSKFQDGKSIRALARTLNVSVFSLTEEAARGLENQTLRLTPRYAWHGLRVQHALSSKAERLPLTRTLFDLPPYLDGKRNMGDLIEVGFKPEVLRIWLVNALRSGEVNVAGRGWLLRDLTWEFEKQRT